MEKEKRSVREKGIIRNIIKWIIILTAIVIVYFWKNDEINDAFREMRHFPVITSILCLLATSLHFVVEGRIIHDMTMYEERQMTWFEAFKCGLYCAFYKLISLGSLSGIAEVYYISKTGIDPGRSSGITIAQYAYQKLGVTILGVVGFITLYAGGISTVREYAKWGILGTLVALIIVTVLLLVSVSKKAVGILAFLVKKLIGSEGLIKNIKGVSADRKRDAIIGKLYTFNDAGLYFWKHKTLCLKVTLLKMLKMALWYSVSGITVFTALSLRGDVTIKDFLIPLTLMAVANMIGTVMVAPAGAGTLEFVVTLLFAPLYGNTAATVVILYRFYSMVVPFLFGAIVFATDNNKNKT